MEQRGKRGKRARGGTLCNKIKTRLEKRKVNVLGTLLTTIDDLYLPLAARMVFAFLFSLYVLSLSLSLSRGTGGTLLQLLINAPLSRH